MSGMPWIRFFPSDWLASTRGMGAAETGVFITLLSLMYERGAPIPEDAGRLARFCGASNAVFRKALDALIAEGKILRVEGGLWNRRVEKETGHRQEKSDAARTAGLASGRARRADNSETEGLSNENPGSRISGRAPVERGKAQSDQGAGRTDVPSPLNVDRTNQKPDTRSQRREERRTPDGVVHPPPSAAPEAVRPDPVDPADDIVEAFDAYNEAARGAGWPVALDLTAERRTGLARRLAECGGVPGWRAALARARASPFLCGDNPKGWRANLKFFLQKSSFQNLREGSYDDRKKHAAFDRQKPVSPASAFAAVADKYAALGDAGGGYGFDADGNSGGAGADRRGQVDYLPPDRGDRRCAGPGAGGGGDDDGFGASGGLFGGVAFAC